MVPSGVENVGEPPVPPTEPVASPVVAVSPALVLPPTETALSVELPPVVTALPPPEPVVAAAALVELLEVTDTIPAVMVALLVVEGPVVGPPLVLVGPELVVAVSSSLLAGALPESPLQLARPSRSREEGSQAAR